MIVVDFRKNIYSRFRFGLVNAIDTLMLKIRVVWEGIIIIINWIIIPNLILNPNLKICVAKL